METYDWLFRKEVMAFFVSMAAMGASFAVIGSFLFIYMIEDLGATPLLRGLSGPFAVALELPFFYYGNEVGFIVVSKLWQPDFCSLSRNSSNSWMIF